MCHIEKINMLENTNAKFIFKSKEVNVPIKSKDCENFPQKLLLDLLIQHQYEIQSNVCEEVFQSFIKYFTDGVIPDIESEKINEYDQLNQEFQIPSISEIIQTKYKIIDEISKNIKLLTDDSISNKSDIEHIISNSLDDYLLTAGPELLNVPVQILYDIISYQDCKFTQHNLLYKLILSHYENTKKSDIFVLLQFKPKFDTFSLFDKISKLEKFSEEM